MTNTTTPRRPRRLMWAPVAAAVALSGMAACGDDDDDGDDPGVEEFGDDNGVDDDGVYEDDELGAFDDEGLVGETVTISGPVDRVLEDGKSFVVGEDVVDDGVLVLTPPRADVAGVTIEEGAEVQVEGEVTEFVATDIEADYDPFDLDDDLYADYEDDSVLVAQSVTAPDGGRQPTTTSGMGATTTTSAGATTTAG